jgi:CheY-like chemotaxis protein
LAKAGRQEFDLLRALHVRGGATIPAIAVNEYGQEQDLQQSREVGFAIHLTKPMSLWQLYDAIARVVIHGGPAPA